MSVDHRPAHLTEPRWVRGILLGIALLFLTLFLLVPLAAVFAEAFRKGWALYLEAIVEPDAWAAIRLTLLVAAIALPVNLVFGGRRLGHHQVPVSRQTVPDHADRPAVLGVAGGGGLVFVLLFGTQGWFGGWLQAHDIKIVYAVPGIILASLFVTFPFVARELIPLMQAQGSEEEQAALTLGANGWQIFWRVTLPNIGACCTAPSCATRAPWASSAPCRWCPARCVA